MQILLANPRGFCAGVDRAISIVENALAIYGAPIYVRHEVVHNRYVVDSLRERGADRDGDVSERLAVAQLHDGVVNALRRADDDRRISEALAFTPVAVQEPACEPPFDDGEHHRWCHDNRATADYTQR